MSFIAPIASAIGVGASIFGQIKGGKAAQKQAAFEAAQAADQAAAEAENLDFQAKQQRIQAIQERAQSHIAMARANRKNKALLSTQKAGMAGSGFMADDQTNRRITKDTVREATIDELLIKAQGEDTARQMETQADIFETSANNVRKGGKATTANILKSGQNAYESSLWGAGATLLSGATSWLSKYGVGKSSAVGAHSVGNYSAGHETPAFARLR